MSHHRPEGATGVARYPHNVNIAFAGLGGLGCAGASTTRIMPDGRVVTTRCGGGLGTDEIAALEQQVQDYEGEIQQLEERKRLFPYFAAFVVGAIVGRAMR